MHLDTRQQSNSIARRGFVLMSKVFPVSPHFSKLLLADAPDQTINSRTPAGFIGATKPPTH
jgi:hypothetical protein